MFDPRFGGSLKRADWGEFEERAPRKGELLAPEPLTIEHTFDTILRVWSVRPFPPPDRLADLMRDVGFVGVEYRRMGLGIIALHSGRAP